MSGHGEERRHAKSKRVESEEKEESPKYDYENEIVEETPLKKRRTVSGPPRDFSFEERTYEYSEESEVRPRKKSVKRESFQNYRRKSESVSDEFAKENEEIVERRRKRIRKSRKRKEDDGGKPRGSLRKSETEIEKSRRRKERSNEDEIPITEVLKKAQERTKYEDPIPFPELTSDTIYVQGRNGFSAVKIGKSVQRSQSDRFRRRKRQTLNNGNQGNSYPIRIAISAQKFWKSSGCIYQGLLGGMAFMHLLMMETFFNSTMDFVLQYSMLSEIYINIFSFLITMSVISVFDKYDLAHLDKTHVRDVFKNHMKSILSIPLYLATLCLHQSTLKVDDQLSLVHYYSNDTTNFTLIWGNDTQFDVFLDRLSVWQRITSSKDILAVVSWFFVSVDSQEDMLLSHLESMEKFADNVKF